MFRAEILQLENIPTLKLQGRLVGEWAGEAKSLVTEESIPKGLIIDITEVTCIDADGERVLSWLGSVGAAFVANNVYVASVCERLGLPLYESSSSSSNGRRKAGGRGSPDGHNGSRRSSPNVSEK